MEGSNGFLLLGIIVLFFSFLSFCIGSILYGLQTTNNDNDKKKPNDDNNSNNNNSDQKPFSDTQKQLILETHNRLRKERNLPPLVWDETGQLDKWAGDYGRSCWWGHDGPRPAGTPKSENICYPTYEDMDRPNGDVLSTKECLKGTFDDEKNDATNKCKVSYGCNHYNFITNPTLKFTKIGGMMTKCSALKNTKYKNVWKFVFFYGPPYMT
jgi:hypothetical protein